MIRNYTAKVEKNKQYPYVGEILFNTADDSSIFQGKTKKQASIVNASIKA
jgi:hypothetical protein